MEVIGIGLTTIALVALAMSAGLALEILRRSDRLMESERRLTHEEARSKQLAANLEALDRLRRLERARANALEQELFNIGPATGFGGDVQRRLLEKWKGSVDAAHSAFADSNGIVPVPAKEASDSEPGPVTDPGMLERGEVSDADDETATADLRPPVRSRIMG